MNFKALKMNGLGNDFLIIDNRNQSIKLSEEDIIKLSDRTNSIGFDQLIMIRNSTTADADIDYFNSDGKIANACGNGNRCVADILMNEKKTKEVHFNVGSFTHLGTRSDDNLISIVMPQPNNELKKIPVTDEVQTNPLTIEVEGYKLEGHLLNVGNPHIVVFQEISDLELTKIGPIIENYKFFPDRINVTFAKIEDSGNIKVNVWERGAGKTLACGTAACATGFIATELKLSRNPVNIHFEKGFLKILINENKTITMTGPVSDQKIIEVRA